MRFRILILTSLIFSPLFALATDFPRTLKVGMRGEDVRALQVFLNTDSGTRVAKTGAGSPGNETDYFGPATKRALIKFQEKYASDILTPFSLTKGTGIFGEKTRARIVALQNVRTAQLALAQDTMKEKTATQKESDQTTISEPRPVPWTPDRVVPPGTNPNSLNLEYAISETKKLGARQGMSDANLSTLEKAIRLTAATSTDLTKKFFENATVKYVDAKSFNKKLAVPKETLFGKILTALGLTKEARAAVPVPFGGTVPWAFPCTCSAAAVWVIGITPLPPSYAAILSYTQGTQLFLNYNIGVPSQSLLGFYLAGIQECLMLAPVPADPCVPYPTEGVISPEVGSSL